MNNDWVKPAALRNGGTVAFTAPASAHKEDLGALRSLWENEGYKVVFGDSCYRQGMYGGTPEEQAEEFNRLMTDDCCDAVIAVRGGYGSMRYLDLLDYKGIRNKRKPFLGYSDCTALHCALHVHSRLITYHGPMGVDLLKDRPEDFTHELELLRGDTRVIAPLPGYAMGEVSTHEEGARIFGGNLTLISGLAGTPYGLTETFMKGQILFLEEIKEPPYKVDRMLEQLRLQGIFRAVRAVALGTFTECNAEEDDSEEEKNYDVSARIMELLQKESEGEEKFVFFLPAGHGTPHWAIPLGSEVSFSLVANSLICFPYTESKV